MGLVCKFPRKAHQPTRSQSVLCAEYFSLREKINQRLGVRWAWSLLVGGLAASTIVVFDSNAWLLGLIVGFVCGWAIFSLSRWESAKTNEQARIDKILIGLATQIEKLPYNYEVRRVFSSYYSGRMLGTSDWNVIDKAVGFVQSRLDIEQIFENQRRFKGEVINLFESTRSK